MVRQVLNLPIAPTKPTPDALQYLFGEQLGRKDRKRVDVAESIPRPVKGATDVHGPETVHDPEIIVPLEP